MKKLVAFILLPIFVIALSLIGCKTVTTQAKETTTITEETTVAEETAVESQETQEELTEKVKLTCVEIYSEDLDKSLTEYINLFQQENPNIEVQLSHYALEDARNAFQSGVLAGAGPQLLLGPHDWAGLFAASEIVKPVAEIIDMNLFAEGPRNAGAYQGQLWGIPFETESAVRLYYNKDIIPEPPSDTDTLTTKAKEVTKGEVVGFGYWIKAPYYFIPWYSAYGGWPLDENNNPSFDNDACLKALKLLVRWTSKDSEDRLMDPQLGVEEWTALFKEGKLGMTISGEWDYVSFKESLGDKLDFVRLPKVSDGDWPISYNSVKLWYISKLASETELKAIKKFIEFMSSKDVQIGFVVEKTNKIPVTI
ncbi:MAG: extracellular solute-binding protein, partial [Actinobacteria bacterium]|nr:extracellular solute-binding protein [Actinomycetota bacterium]